MADHKTCPTCNGTGKLAMAFGDRLSELRRERHVTQEMLAPIIGLSRPQVANLEVGKSQPTTLTLIAIANHFDVSVDWLLGRKDSDHA